MAQPLDPYRTLGLHRDATEAEVKAAHRKLAKRFHPDKEGGDRERFLKVQEAYRVLSDALARKEWDDRHAPGPMRAHRPSPSRSSAAGAAADGAKPRPPRRPARPRNAPETEPGNTPPTEEPPNRRPRSSRAYTWSASEVPWWEEGATSSNKRQPGRRRPAGEGPATGEGATPPKPPTPDNAGADP